MSKIFISYARADQAFALRLAKALRDSGFDLWIDQLDIATGQRWDDAIERALEACPAFLIVLSPASVASDNVRDEINFALEMGKDMVPVLYQLCTVPFRVRRFQHVDFTGDEAAALATFRDRLRRLAAGAHQPSVPGVALDPLPVKTGRGDAEREAAARQEREEETLVQSVMARFKAEGYVPVVVRDGAREKTLCPKPGAGEVLQDCVEVAGRRVCGPELVVLPTGNFMMGSRGGEGDGDERPQHKVTIAQPFAVGRFAVTFDEWDAAQVHPEWQTHTKPAPREPSDTGWGRGRRPVINVSWKDATAYCTWLSKVTGQPYRLLSEAEWEYACRAGTTTAYHFGETISTDQANYDGNHTYGPGGKRGVYQQRTIEVGSLNAPNAWGLHDMHGNVWEWCAGGWHDTYAGAPSDGSARTSDGNTSRKVFRGGSWDNNPRILRAANRDRSPAGYCLSFVGFRVARLVSLPRTL